MHPRRRPTRRVLFRLGTAGLGAGCRRRSGSDLIPRLSHSMTAGPTALHVFADAFRQNVESMSGGAVKVRLFPSGTLGQEREVVQQLQEGLVDFMVSGGHLGQRGSPAAGPRFSVPVARLGSRAPGDRFIARHISRGYMATSDGRWRGAIRSVSGTSSPGAATSSSRDSWPG